MRKASADLKSLSGKTAVVVGAGSIGPGWSNGSAVAAVYARQGATVVCVDYFMERANDTAEAIKAGGGRAIALQADATKEKDMQQIVYRTLEATGKLDIMHNNVGIGRASGTPDTISYEDWNGEIAQNLSSAYLGTRVAAPIMRKQGAGVIINISSLLSTRFLARPNVAYSAAKAAVEALTRSCAAAYGRDNIRVNCIRIGFSETPVVMRGLAKLSEEQKQAALNKTRAKVPLRREHGNPFDVAHAAAFLASDAAAHLTGVILNVDGGLECAPI